MSNVWKLRVAGVLALILASCSVVIPLNTVVTERGELDGVDQLTSEEMTVYGTSPPSGVISATFLSSWQEAQPSFGYPNNYPVFTVYDRSKWAVVYWRRLGWVRTIAGTQKPYAELKVGQEFVVTWC